MPFYEYQCIKCEKCFEVMLTITEREKRESDLACPTCGTREPRRLLSAFATPSSTPSPNPKPPSCGGG